MAICWGQKNNQLWYYKYSLNVAVFEGPKWDQGQFNWLVINGSLKRGEIHRK